MATDGVNIGGFLRSAASKLSSLIGKKSDEQSLAETIEGPVCCNPENTVHIAFRGLSDDRMYIAYNRRYPELRYFRGNGLRAYCVECRRRVF
jgi:hypothetical protein